MHPRFALTVGVLGFAAALVAAPFGVQVDTASLYGKSALAAGNGNGGGNGGGNGHGNGKGRGNGQGPTDGLTASDSQPGKSGSAPGHGGTANGQAIGHDAVSGVEVQSAHKNGQLVGNLHASNASAQGLAHASSNSIPGQIREAIQAAYRNSGDENDVVNSNEIDLEALENALADIRNRDSNTEDSALAESSSSDADSSVASSVADKVDGKVAEPPAP